MTPELTEPQVSCLRLMQDGRSIDFSAAYDLGCSGRSMSGLVRKGLAYELVELSGYKRWGITDAGREALAIVAANNGGE